MKNITVKLYSIDELERDVQMKVVDRERWNVQNLMVDTFYYDYAQTMTTFANTTGTEIQSYDVNYARMGPYYRFCFTSNFVMGEENDKGDFSISGYKIKGKLLRRWVNRFIDNIRKNKYTYINRYDKYVGIHYGVTLEDIDNGWFPLTGYSEDNTILRPIVDYYYGRKKTDDDFCLSDLLDECYREFFNSWYEEICYWADNDDAILEELRENSAYENILYYKDGTAFELNNQQLES